MEDEDGGWNIDLGSVQWEAIAVGGGIAIILPILLHILKDVFNQRRQANAELAAREAVQEIRSEEEEKEVAGRQSDLDKVRSLLKDAGTALVERRVRESVSLYSEALRLTPAHLKKHHIILANRSIALLRLGDVEASLADAQAAIDENPAYAMAYYRKAHALEYLERLEEAAAVYEEALAEGCPLFDLPANGQYKSQFQQFLKRMEMKKESMDKCQELMEAIAKTPTSQWPKHRIGDYAFRMHPLLQRLTKEEAEDELEEGEVAEDGRPVQFADANGLITVTFRPASLCTETGSGAGKLLDRVTEETIASAPYFSKVEEEFGTASVGRLVSVDDAKSLLRISGLFLLKDCYAYGAVFAASMSVSANKELLEKMAVTFVPDAARLVSGSHLWAHHSIGPLGSAKSYAEVQLPPTWEMAITEDGRSGVLQDAGLRVAAVFRLASVTAKGVLSIAFIDGEGGAVQEELLAHGERDGDRSLLRTEDRVSLVALSRHASGTVAFHAELTPSSEDTWDVEEVAALTRLIVRSSSFTLVGGRRNSDAAVVSYRGPECAMEYSSELADNSWIRSGLLLALSPVEASSVAISLSSLQGSEIRDSVPAGEFEALVTSLDKSSLLDLYATIVQRHYSGGAAKFDSTFFTPSEFAEEKDWNRELLPVVAESLLQRDGVSTKVLCFSLADMRSVHFLFEERVGEGYGTIWELTFSCPAASYHDDFSRYRVAEMASSFHLS